MTTTEIENTVSPKARALTILVLTGIALLGTLAILAIAFHFSADELFDEIASFAEHHYLIFGIFCATLAIILYRCYLLLTEQVKPALKRPLFRRRRRKIN